MYSTGMYVHMPSTFGVGFRHVIAIRARDFGDRDDRGTSMSILIFVIDAERS